MMKKRDGRKLSSKAFRKRTIPVAVFFSVVLVIANIVVNLYSAAITSYMGVGDATVTSKYDTAGWNVAYYDQKYQTSAESLAAAAEVAEGISDEGITLVKNSNNTLH